MITTSFTDSLKFLNTQIRNRLRRGEGGFMFYTGDDDKFLADIRLNLESKRMIINNVAYKSIDQLSAFFDSIDNVMREFGYEVLISNKDQIPQDFYLTRVCNCASDPLWLSANKTLETFYNAAIYRTCAPDMSVHLIL